MKRSGVRIPSGPPNPREAASRGMTSLTSSVRVMPMPRRWARTNTYTFNPRELKKRDRPVLIHVGRASGRENLTPLDAHPFGGGFLFIPIYGVNSDWGRNVLVAGSARVRVNEQEIALTNPRMIDAAAGLDPRPMHTAPTGVAQGRAVLADRPATVDCPRPCGNSNTPLACRLGALTFLPSMKGRLRWSVPLVASKRRRGSSR